MTRRRRPPLSGRALANQWRAVGGANVALFGLAYPPSVFEAERKTMARKLEMACDSLEAACDDPGRLRVVLQVLDIRARGLVCGPARRLLLALVQAASDAATTGQ